MKWKELIVNILSINTALYAILVIVNPNNYFGNGETTKLLALEQILSYPNRELAIQLIGTTILGVRILANQEKGIAHVATLTGTLIVWIGLAVAIQSNPLLLRTTLVIIPELTILVLFLISINKLTSTVTTWLKRRANFVQQWAMNLIQSIRIRISKWTTWIWHTISRPWQS